MRSRNRNRSWHPAIIQSSRLKSESWTRDNFGARYYASTTGRFMTPDWALKPVSMPYAKFGDPQTLNLYTYIENSPLNRIDADGHDSIDISGGMFHTTFGTNTSVLSND